MICNVNRSCNADYQLMLGPHPSGNVMGKRAERDKK